MIRAVLLVTYAALMGAILRAAGLEALILAPLVVTTLAYAIRNPVVFWGALCR